MAARGGLIKGAVAVLWYVLQASCPASPSRQARTHDLGGPSSAPSSPRAGGFAFTSGQVSGGSEGARSRHALPTLQRVRRPAVVSMRADLAVSAYAAAILQRHNLDLELLAAGRAPPARAAQPTWEVRIDPSVAVS